MSRVRLDKLLVSRGLAETRERARRLIEDGKVEVDGVIAPKPSSQIASSTAVRLREPDHPYVSRGGLKLQAGLDAFGLDPSDRVAMDVGASTGGFTDVLLQRGARRVYAIDVGYGQLAWKLRQDERVVVVERENIRYTGRDKVPDACTFAVIDVSFISLATVLPNVAVLLAPASPIVALVKPQFEVGKGHVGKGGVVRDEALRLGAVHGVQSWAVEHGFEIGEFVASPIRGPAGNVEYLLSLTTPPRRSV